MLDIIQTTNKNVPPMLNFTEKIPKNNHVGSNV